MAKGETLGARIQRLRQSAGLSQTQLADRAGVGLSALRNYEQGVNQPKAPTLVALAKALGVTTDALLGIEADKGDAR